MVSCQWLVTSGVTEVGKGQHRGREEKRVTMGLYEIMCEASENCKALQNLKNLSFNKKNFFKDDSKILMLGFPGGTVVENLPANAGDTGSSPGLGRSHMPQSNWAREPQLLSLRLWSLCSATREATIVRGPRTAMKSDPRLPQLEKALTQKRRPNTAKNK